MLKFGQIKYHVFQAKRIYPEYLKPKYLGFRSKYLEKVNI